MRLVTRLSVSIALVILALLLFVSFFWIIPNSVNAVFSVDTDEKVVALTFDDGPYPPYTRQILDILARENIKATFFMAGANLEQHMELGRQVIAEGHQAGNHLYNGESLVFKSPSFAAERFYRTDELLRRIGVADDPILVRQGRGAGGPMVGWIVWREGRTQILADAAANDWVRPNWQSNTCPNLVLPCPTQVAEEIVNQIMRKVQPGSIILLHEGYDNGPGANRRGTVAALEMLIKQLRNNGYRFVALSELLALDSND